VKLTRLVRGELDWIVMKCLEKDRSRRYETAGGLARDVQRYLAGEAVEASPPSAAYRLKKFLRRHRGPVLAGAAMFALLIAGVVGTTWGLVRAEKRLRQVEAGSAILASVFADLDPWQEERGGPPLRAVLGDRLARAAEQLQGEAVGDPLLVADLQHRLGKSLIHLGLPDRAVPVFARVRATRAALLGADHPDTLASAANLGHAYQAAGRLDEALPLLRDTHARMTAVLGPDCCDTLTNVNNLAVADKAAGRLDEALSLWEEMVARLKALLGPNHQRTLTAMSNLADGYLAAGDLDRARSLNEETLRLRTAALGPDHPDTLVSMTNLAVAYRAAGRLDLALPLFERALRGMTAKLGANHPTTLLTMNHLAIACKAAGQPDRALPLYEESFRLLKARLGADHPDTLLALNNLAEAHRDAGRPEQALPLFKEAAAGLDRRRFQHEHAGRIVGNLICDYERRGHFDRAEPWRRKWLAAVREASGPDSLPYAAELAALGLNLLHQERWADAEPVLREGLAVRATQEPDAWTTFNARSMLGGALLGQQKYADAEPLLLAGYEGMKARNANIPAEAAVRPAEALERLIQLYRATGRPQKAAEWQKELEAAKP
jgi:tetratricopeptide (TPR) repeat protein